MANLTRRRDPVVTAGLRPGHVPFLAAGGVESVAVRLEVVEHPVDETHELFAIAGPTSRASGSSPPARFGRPGRRRARAAAPAPQARLTMGADDRDGAGP
ncbi:hypothetical protein [Actinomadura macra]|uniref:hypothetical protein n=1 Tax=Actinomadura macra TaxID=46164 RepID=UPI0012F72F42|nr:hypothetical protein [Actinomadura macra]